MRLLVLDRYIARELVAPFVFGVALFTFFLVVDRIYHLTDLVITKACRSISSFSCVLSVLLTAFVQNTRIRTEPAAGASGSAT